MVPFDRALELADPGPLVVTLIPGRDGFAKMVELNAPMTLPGPDVGERATELGVPQQGGRSSIATTMPT